MRALGRGWFDVTAPGREGDRYGFSVDGGPVRPDPASRRQPGGVHERSELVDPAAFAWSPSEEGWRAPPIHRGVVYELHAGTFTPEGTLAAAARRLEHVRDLGVTHVEVMPVNAFGGTRGWGYDGVGWYAVHEPYGGPHGLVAFVDACHQAGLAVVLDVVHNHLGPSGNYLPEFGPYLAGGRDNTWGQGLNLDGPGSDAVRAFVIGNALLWLRDYHVDALRLDAVHALLDGSAVHVLAELSEAVRDLAVTSGRRHELIAESDRNDPLTVRPRALGGLGLDAQWADDLHHALHVAVTGEDEGYYGDYTGLPDVVAAYRRGFVFDGRRYSAYRDRTPGAPLGDVSGARLVGCLQNHDQVGNRAAGERIDVLAPADLVRVAVLLLVAAPHVPLLFAGEEYGETSPFLFFTDHPEPELAEAVRRGRAEEFAAFSAFTGDVPDPLAEATFAASKLDWTAADTSGGNARMRLWRDLLALRRAVPALHAGRRDLVEVVHVDGAALVVLRGGPDGSRVAVTANLGAGEAALPTGGARGRGDARWTARVATGDERYGGPGAPPPACGDASFVLPPRSACLWTRDEPR
jgi:maltooligosyltrehalose trehalohydrolase